MAIQTLTSIINMRTAYIVLLLCFSALLYVTVTKAQQAGRDVGLPSQFVGRGAI